MPNLQLENDDSQQKEVGNAPVVESSKGPQYPSGLCLYLDSDTVVKLGIEDCGVGCTFDLQGKGKITSVSENDGEGQKYSKTVTIQVTDLEAEEIGDDGGKAVGQDNETDVLDTMESKMKDAIQYVSKRK